jgi:beta-lactamase superfamily II metal-dependent hydrolase
MERNDKKWVYIILGGLACANIIALSVVLSLAKHKDLEVDFLDVGQGDASFIE